VPGVSINDIRGHWEEGQLVSGPITIESSRKKGPDVGYGIQRKLVAGLMLNVRASLSYGIFQPEEISIAANAVDGKAIDCSSRIGGFELE
jgi:hypothetical protein